MSKVTTPQQLTCGTVWGTNCSHVVDPPSYTHGDHPDLESDFGINGSTAQEALLAIAQAVPEPARVLLAANPTVPPPVLEYMANDDSHDVRLSLAANPSLPAPAIGKMVRQLGHEDVFERLALAENPNVTHEVLQELYARFAGDPWILAKVAKHPNTHKSTLWRILRHEQPGLSLANVAENINCSRRMLRYILRRAEIAVSDSTQMATWKAVAGNPNCSRRMMQQFTDYGPAVKEELAKNPACPPSIRESLLREYQSPNVLIALATRPDIESSVLEKLCTSEYAEVREAAASHPKCPEHVRLIQNL